LLVAPVVAFRQIDEVIERLRHPGRRTDPSPEVTPIMRPKEPASNIHAERPGRAAADDRAARCGSSIGPTGCLVLIVSVSCSRRCGLLSELAA
jgi:hypothetical protein